MIKQHLLVALKSAFFFQVEHIHNQLQLHKGFPMAPSDDRESCFGFGSNCQWRRFLRPLRGGRRDAAARGRRRSVGTAAARRGGAEAARVEVALQGNRQEVRQVLPRLWRRRGW